MREQSGLILAAALVGALVVPFHAATAAAQTTLEKVKAQGYVQCGSTLRPGLAATDGKDHWSGLEVEMCRAIAIAIFGPSGHFAYHQYDSDKDFDLARHGYDQVSFLTFTEMAAHHLTDKLSPGPTVFIESHDLLVAADGPIHHPEDLASKSVCFIIQTAANESLDAWYEERKIPIVRKAYQEDGEMYDGYAVQTCQAVVGESTTLADAALDGGVNHLKSRLVPDHLATFPIVAATPVGYDAQWAAIVNWTIDTVKNADARETTYRPNGLRAMPVDGAGLGLAADWQKAVVETVGSYSSIFRKTLGAGSPLNLAPGLNAAPADGGVMFVAHTD